MTRHTVVLERVHRQVLAVARALEAAVWHLADPRKMSVDPAAAVLQPGGDLHAARDVARPDGRGQTILGVVRPTHRIVGVRESSDGNHRSEHFALHDLVGLPGTGDDRWLVEESLAGGCSAAGSDLHMRLGGRARHKTGNAFALAMGYQRAHLDPGFLLSPDLDGAHRLR